MEDMATTYVHHRIATAPLHWRSAADRLMARRASLSAAGGELYGIWRSQIGRPRDELTAITVWAKPVSATQAQSALTGGAADVQAVSSLTMTPTSRPRDTRSPERQGNYAFRWFVTPEENWQEFLALCAQAWPGFEAAYDSQVIGLWRCTGDAAGHAGTGSTDADTSSGIRSLLLTRRPDLAMWERSKLPQGAAEAAVRATLSRRYDLCSWTVVYTTTLLTATDSADHARWA
jgi:hypothetical protein